MKVHMLFAMIGFLYSCNRASLDDFSYSGNFLTSEQTYLNGIPQREKALESFTDLVMNDSNQFWTKKVFVRYYESLDHPSAFVFDTVNYVFVVNPELEITRVKNWKQIREKMKKRVNNVLEASYTKEEQAKATDFVEQVVMDSTLIMAKNTLDIELINLGIRYFTDPDYFKQPAFKITKPTPDRIQIKGTFSIPDETLEYPVNKVMNASIKNSYNTKRSNNSKKMSGQTSVTFLIDPKNKRILYARQQNRIGQNSALTEFVITVENYTLNHH